MPFAVATRGGNYLELAEPLLVAGAFDQRFVVCPLALEARGRAFLSWLGPELCDSSLLDNPTKVGQALESDFPSIRRQGPCAVSCVEVLPLVMNATAVLASRR